MSKKRTIKHTQIIEGTDSIEDFIKAVTDATLNSVAIAFGADTIGELLFDEMRDSKVPRMLWARKVKDLVGSMDDLHEEFTEKLKEIAEENGFSFDIVEFMFYAPFFAAHLKENFTIGKSTVISEKDERGLN